MNLNRRIVEAMNALFGDTSAPQQEFAKKIGVSAARINQIVTDSNRSVGNKILEGLNEYSLKINRPINFNYLFRGEGSIFSDSDSFELEQKITEITSQLRECHASLKEAHSNLAERDKIITQRDATILRLMEDHKLK